MLCVLVTHGWFGPISQQSYSEGSGSCVDVRVPYMDGLRVTRRDGSNRSSRQTVSGQMVLITPCRIRWHDLLLRVHFSSYPFFCNSLPGIAWRGSTTLESGFFPVYLSMKRNSRPKAFSSRPVSIHYDHSSIGRRVDENWEKLRSSSPGSLCRPECHSSSGRNSRICEGR